VTVERLTDVCCWYCSTPEVFQRPNGWRVWGKRTTSPCKPTAVLQVVQVADSTSCPHCPLGPIAFAASLQVCLSTPNFAILEMSLGMRKSKDQHQQLQTLHWLTILA
jgi:hypothetical protein